MSFFLGTISGALAAGGVSVAHFAGCRALLGSLLIPETRTTGVLRIFEYDVKPVNTHIMQLWFRLIEGTAPGRRRIGLSASHMPSRCEAADHTFVCQPSPPLPTPSGSFCRRCSTTFGIQSHCAPSLLFPHEGTVECCNSERLPRCAGAGRRSVSMGQDTHLWRASLEKTRVVLQVACV